MSSGTVGASPHRADPTVNTAIPTKNTRRRPTRSAVRPPTTRRDPKTTL